MPSSTSSSLSDPSVSVVVASNASPESLEGCLAALERQRDGVQVVVVAASELPTALVERHPWATFHVVPGSRVPVLWREGIDRSDGEIVALTIAQMVPAADWIEAIRREHAAHDAVGGAIDPGERLRLTDWAEYFCRYSRELRPFPAGGHGDLAGDNVSFKRSLLDRHHDLLRDGYWEPVLHPALRAEGVDLWRTPDVLVRQGRSAGFGAFARQRLKHGRLYGHQRGEHFSAARNAIGVAAAPAAAALMTVRVAREVFGRGRFRVRFAAALPLIIVFNVIWAYAEARGHLETLAGR
jgi:hypothetical protein